MQNIFLDFISKTLHKKLQLLLSKSNLLRRTTRNCPQVFCQKRVLKNFAKFTDPVTLLERRLQHWCYLLNSLKFLRTPFFIELLRWLLLQDKDQYYSLPPITLREQCFFRGDFFTRTLIYCNSQVKFTSSIPSVAFFDILIYRGYYALQCHGLKQTCKRKKAIFKNR